MSDTSRTEEQILNLLYGTSGLTKEQIFNAVYASGEVGKNAIAAMEGLVVAPFVNVCVVGPGQDPQAAVDALALIASEDTVTTPAHSIIDVQDNPTDGSTVTVTVDGVPTVFLYDAFGAGGDGHRFSPQLDPVGDDIAYTLGEAIRSALGEQVDVATSGEDALVTITAVGNATLAVSTSEPSKFVVTSVAETTTRPCVVVCMPGVSREVTEAVGVKVVYIDDWSNIAAKMALESSQALGLIEASSRKSTIAPAIQDNGFARANATRTKHTINQPVSSLVFEWGNSPAISDFETGVSTYSEPFEIVCAYVEVANKIYPLTFNGQPGVFGGGDCSPIYNDPLPIMLAPGDVVYARQVSRTNGVHTLVPAVVLIPADDLAVDLARNVSLVAAQAVMTAPITAAPWTSPVVGRNGYIAAPTAVLGCKINHSKPSILLIGDSILNRFAANGHNWISKFLSDHGYPYSICARNGERPAVARDHNKRIDSMFEALCPDIVICALGVNDIWRGLNLTQDSLIALWAKFPGARIIQTTITPQPGGNAGLVANTATINEWIRLMADGKISAVWDYSDIVSTSRDSNVSKSTSGNVWLADNLHPSGAYGVPGIQAALEADSARWLSLLG